MFYTPDTIIGTQFPTLPPLSTAISSANVPPRYYFLLTLSIKDFYKFSISQDDEPTVALVMGGRHPGHYFMDKDDFNDIVTRTEVCPVQIKVSFRYCHCQCSHIVTITGGGSGGDPGGGCVPVHCAVRCGAVWRQEWRGPGARGLPPVQPHLAHGQ